MCKVLSIINGEIHHLHQIIQACALSRSVKNGSAYQKRFILMNRASVSAASLLSFVLIVGTVAGCTTRSRLGQPFIEGTVSSIKIGKTTESEVASMLGEPLSKNIAGDDDQVWIYKYTESTQTAAPGMYDLFFAGKQETEHKEVTVTFKKGIVSDCSYMQFDSATTGTLMERMGQTGYGAGTRVTTRCDQAKN